MDLLELSSPNCLTFEKAGRIICTFKNAPYPQGRGTRASGDRGGVWA